MGLHRAAESRLCILRHGVTFVQNDQFERGAGISRCLLGTNAALSKRFDFLPNNLNTSLIRSIQLQHTIFVELGAAKYGT
jgi:hypothetical protein